MHSGASPLVNQEAADSQGMVTNELGLQTLPWSTGKKTIFGITLSKLGLTDTGLAVGGGGDDLVEEGLYIPIGFEEADGKVIEECLVAGMVTLSAKVLGSCHDARAKKQLPVAVDSHTGG